MNELKEIVPWFDQLVRCSGPDREHRLDGVADPRLRSALRQLLESSDRAAASGFLATPRD